MSDADVKLEGKDLIWIPLLLVVVALICGWVFVGHDVVQYFGVIGTALYLIFLVFLAAARHENKLDS